VSPLKSKTNKLSDTVTVVLFAVPVLGLLMGGVYSMPAIHFTRGREPWLSILLSVGLAVTVFGVGSVLHVPLAYLAIIWVFTIGLLLGARALLGSLDHNLERFGMVHGLALFITFLVSMVTKHGTSGNA
jgi:hypothetical protein